MTAHAGMTVAAPSSVGLTDAAALLGAHPETVRLKAKAGEIPGRKVGKRWMFSTIALERYLAGQWIPRVVQGDQAKEGEPCRSSNAKVATTGITSCTPARRASGTRKHWHRRPKAGTGAARPPEGGSVEPGQAGDTTPLHVERCGGALCRGPGRLGQSGNQQDSPALA